ncbi:major facilitator superfamily domain-containing protein [Biscogniauxia sp. FL1348]|nr:major facilitator superfamily domain-containing protein [Biscogniauxia sp. FL1348]
MAAVPDEKKPDVVLTIQPLTNSEASLPAIEAVEAGPNLPNDDNDADHYPDGGSKAWLQVLACHLVNTMACGYGAAFGIYQLYYTETLGLPSSQVSWIGSVQIFLNNAICVVAGRLADAGYVRGSVLGGSFLALVGTFMTSLATQYWQIFLAQGICTGLGLGFMFMPTVTIITSYFRKRRALALTLSSAGTGTGSIIFPATVQYLIPRIGFPWAVRCAGFVALFMIMVMSLLIRPRNIPHKAGPIIDMAAFKEAPYVLVIVGTFFLYWALYFGFFYMNTYAIDIASFTPTSAVSLTLIMNGVGMISRPLIGYLADDFLGTINALIISTVIFAGTLFAWIGIKTAPAMYGFAVLFGLTNSAAQGAVAGALASLTKDPTKMGARFGMCFTIVSIATVAGPPTAGAIIDMCKGSFLWAQVWAGAVTMMSAAAILMARWWVVGWKFWAKV